MENTEFTVEDVQGFGWDDMRRENIAEELEGATIVYAVYETGSYDGSGVVIFKRDGNWYEVSDSHCSCRGMEWGTPEETTPEMILERHNHNWFPDYKRLEFCVKKHLQ